MAPNFAVKSESWLDLSKSYREENYPNSIATSHQQQQNRSDLLNHRHSISNFYSISEHHNQEPANNQRQQQHLLIRLRQQSYLNKSSNSLTSNLSHSIDLNQSLVGIQSERCFSKTGNNLKQLDKADRSSLLKRESHKLRQLRDKLSLRGKRKFKTSHSNDNAENQVSCNRNNDDGKISSTSPIVRSISSFSERLNGKLTSFRHSWKHFLYNYNHNHNRGDCSKSFSVHEDENCYRARLMNEILLGQQRELLQQASGQNQVNKRQFTDDWIQRHHGAGEPERPKSLQIIRSDINSDAPSIDKNNNNNDKISLSPKSFSGTSPASSSTLISASLIQESQLKLSNQDSILSSSCNSNGSTINSLKADLVQRFDFEAEDDSNDSNYAEKVKARTSEKINPLGTREKLTSDYWSTNASSEKFKFKEKQAKSRQVKADEEKSQMMHQQPTSGKNILMTNDQEYYLDVAEAANQQHQLLQRPLTLAGPESTTLADEGRSRIGGPQAGGHLKSSYPQVCLSMQNEDEDYDDYAVPADENCRLDRSQVELVQMIGEGQKGYVFLGKLQSRDGSSIMDVAIKTLKYETDLLIDKLMREAAMMRQLEHPHIIKFIGVCPETPALIAMELAKFGEIKEYLKVNRQVIANSQLVLFTFQISTALSYLESKQYVHRDVAARNVLVCSHNCVKLADFGLSRNLQPSADGSLDGCKSAKGSGNALLLLDHQSDNYVAVSRGKLPVRWMAPESLAFRRFTSASDVWMFAVCSWELFHYGQLRPWTHIRNNQVLLAIESGQRLARPQNCPARLYQLMLQCWNYAPIQRPKFRELKQVLWSVYLNEKAKEQLEVEQQQQRQKMLIGRQAERSFMNLITDRQHTRSSQQNNRSPMAQRPHRPQFAGIAQLNSPPPLNLTNYSSSAATTTAEHSNNSSRSSSMGSLARHKANSNSNRQRQQQSSPNRERGFRDSEVNKQLLESNIKRFHKLPGQVLQKQRSQGDIAVGASGAPAPLEGFMVSRRRQQHGFDDDEILARHRRGLRLSTPNSFGLNLRAAHFDGNDADEEEEDFDSSLDRANKSIRQQVQMRQRTTNQIMQETKKSHLLGPAGFRNEPNYEGLSQRDLTIAHSQAAATNGRQSPVSSSRANYCPQASGQSAAAARGSFNDRISNQVNAKQQARPISWQSQVGGERAPSGSQRASKSPTWAQTDQRSVDCGVRQREEKLANILSSLKCSSPMKAKLTYSNLESRPERSQANKKEDAQREAEQRKLALHQKLLGHIQPASCGQTQRRSANLESIQSITYQAAPASPPARASEKVDQSLQILDSLIRYPQAEQKPKASQLAEASKSFSNRLLKIPKR